jgi:CheY-like chemotaxis protein
MRADPRRHDIPVIAMSGMGTEAELERIAAAGFDGHLIKPVEPSRIEEHLERIRGRGASR